MKRIMWEYKVFGERFNTAREMEKTLNTYGTKNWELIHVEFISNDNNIETFVKYIFKRPVK